MYEKLDRQDLNLHSLWDAGITSSSFMCCSTTPAQTEHLCTVRRCQSPAEEHLGFALVLGNNAAVDAGV